jgi:hypothetical protein
LLQLILPCPEQQQQQQQQHFVATHFVMQKELSWLGGVLVP